MATTKAATRIPMIANTLTHRGVLGLESRSGGSAIDVSLSIAHCGCLRRRVTHDGFSAATWSMGDQAMSCGGEGETPSEGNFSIPIELSRIIR